MTPSSVLVRKRSVTWKRPWHSGRTSSRGFYPVAGAHGRVSAAARPINAFFQALPISSLLRAEVEDRLGPALAGQQAAVYAVAGAEIEQITHELETLATEKGVSIQMGAWIYTSRGIRPLHLEGFDEYPLGEDYVIERWDLALDAAEQQQLEQTAQLAQQLAQKSDAVAAYFGQWARAEPRRPRCQRHCTVRERLGGQGQVCGGVAHRGPGRAQARARSNRRRHREVPQKLSALRDKYRTVVAGTTPSALLLETNSDIVDLQGILKDLVAALKLRAETLRSLASQLSGTVKSSLDQVVESVLSCADGANAEARGLADGFSAALNALKNGRAVNSQRSGSALRSGN